MVKFNYRNASIEISLRVISLGKYWTSCQIIKLNCIMLAVISLH